MPVITISCLGHKGRAGNSMFQYAYARAYARAMGCELQTPKEWWGRRVFYNTTHDAVIDRELPRTVCDSACQKKGLPLGYFVGQTDIDLDLYAQHQWFLNLYTRKDVLEWFRTRMDLEGPIFGEILESFDWHPGHQYAAAHLRRGDYMNDPLFKKLYCSIQDKSYDTAVEQFKIPGPVFKVYEGWRDWKWKEPGLEWLPDFIFLREASWLLRANSTFSWWASTLGNATTYAPLVGIRTGSQEIPFIQGNWPNTAGVFKNQSDLRLKEA